MIILGLPVVNQHFITKQCVKNLKCKDTKIVIIDNASREPYLKSENPAEIIRNKTNRGYYYPLLQLYKKFPDADYIGLMHNDLFLKEEWEDRLKEAFKDPKMGVVGIAGSMEVDSSGGRGNGILCNLGESMPPNATRMTGFSPALLLDGIFMVFRREVIPLLEIDEDIPLFNFVDRQWFLRLFKLGWRSGIIGIKAEHLGGMTEVGDVQYAKDAENWLRERNLVVKGEAAPTTMFNLAQEIYLKEHKGSLIPSRIDTKWQLIN